MTPDACRGLIPNMLRNRFLLPILLSLTACFACRSDASANPAGTTSTTLLENERLSAEAFDLPMRIQPNLSGNFAELRVNHFHSGIDFKTEKRLGVPIYAPADGWVSRIRTASFAFGLALYLDHTNGFTTVYGHLQRYADFIESELLEMQYQRETFELDTLLPPSRIPVRKGQLIGYAGNSGSSAAPHLHFEIRDSKTEETIDPLLWYSTRIKDSQAPKFQRIAIYAQEGKGALGNNSQKYTIQVVKDQKGAWVLNGKLPTAWGEIGLGLNAYDYMDNNSNIYGVCNIKLFLNDELIFFQDVSRFNFDQTRYINSLVDYENWQRSKTWLMKSFVEPGNMLKAYPSLKNKGIVHIDSAATYQFRYEITDRAGNSSQLKFSIQGAERTIEPKKYVGQKMEYWVPNTYRGTDCTLDIPVGALYKDLDFNFSQTPGTGFSDTYHVHNRFTPIHLPAKAAFRIKRDTLSSKKQYYLAKILPTGGSSRIPSQYLNGWMHADLKEFGSYRVLSDTVKPKITPSDVENIAKNNLIRIRISDAASGIQSWRGKIDEKWVLFEHDGKTGWLTCRLLHTPLTKGGMHQLELLVTDACGNENRLIKNFSW